MMRIASLAPPVAGPSPLTARRAVALFVAASSMFTWQAHASPLTIANFGGANGKAQAEAFQKPFSQRHGVQVLAVEYTGDLAPIRAMVKSGRVEWDVAEVESADLQAGCEAGLFEKIDRASLANATQILPRSVHACGVGAFVWSTVLAYDPAKLKDAPKGWADFWNVDKYPGKRGMRAGARYNLEFALMADGVKRDEVYSTLSTNAGIERAIRKLRALRPHIVWWDAGSQPPKLLASGEVVMSTAFNGRIAVANRNDGAPRLDIAWNDAICELDYWVILKGARNIETARRYLDFVTSEEPQLAFSREIPYGPTNYNAILKYDSGRRVPAGGAHQALIDLSMMSSDLPSAPGNFRKSLAFDTDFWTRNGAAIEKRFNEAMR